MNVICDFDGTITRRDTTDAVLEALAGPDWETVEQLWVQGHITAAECMRRQVAMIGGGDVELDALLDGLQLDEGFVAFVAWCEAQDIPVTVVSDGVDYFIHRILDRHGLGRLPIIANHLAGDAGERRLDQPWRRDGCAAGSGVCKCDATSRQASLRPGEVVFIGDGRSDFCVSGRADILFAKDELADYARSRGQPFHAFDTFADVTRTLTALLAASPISARRARRVIAL
jgi:2,3-diketo-5-methylthio-1-phosphopentane phosphatase